MINRNLPFTISLIFGILIGSAQKAFSVTLKFESLTATYTVTATNAEPQNPDPSTFTDQTLTKTATQLGMNINPENPFRAPTSDASLGHAAGDGFLDLKALSSLTSEAALMFAQPVARREIVTATVNVKATYKIEGEQEQLYLITERDTLQGRLQTTVDLNQQKSGDISQATVSFITPRTNRGYVQDAKNEDGSFKIDRSICIPSSTSCTNVTSSEEFSFEPDSTNSTINFDSGKLFFGVLSSGDSFTIDALLKAEVGTFSEEGTGRKTGTALSDFFNTARIELEAEPTNMPPVPEPTSPLSFLALGTALLLKRKLKTSKSTEKDLEKVF